MSLLDQAALSALPLLPTWLMRRLSSRYIAGETLEEALGSLASLQSRGFRGILDLLGEEVTSEDAAREVAAQYQAAAQALAARNLEAYVSVKPTHVGILIREDLAFELYGQVARACSAVKLELRVEMEDHTTTDATLRVFERLRRDHDNVGIVLQARLFRTPADIDALAPGDLWVRMVKGIYLEPAAIAHTEAEPIRVAYVDQVRQLFRRGARVSLATHDEVLAERCLAVAREEEVGPERFEFQVLLGVRQALWKLWSEAGHPVRVYVPYGPDWRAYSTRRLRCNPQIFHHVLRDTLLRR